MVISSRPLVELVPVQPCAMAGRQMVQWDKDSCSDAGFLKIDLLGLGMLSAVEDCVEQVARVHGKTIDLSRIPLQDPDVYAEIQNADTVGTFQIESRAQMQTLLRTRPENLDDLTIQVAIMRPGPIQSKSVHPFIDRRQALREDPGYVPPVEHPLLEEPLRETLGTIIFQDQVLEVAMAVAGFSIGEAEGLRRALSRKRSEAAIEAFRERFVEGAMGKGARRAARARDLRQGRGVRGLRLPEVALGRVRAARVPVGVAAPSPSRRVPLRAAERAADGLLSAGVAGAGRPEAGGGGAAAGREPLRGEGADGGRRGARRPELRRARVGRRRGGRRRGAAVRGRAGARAADRAVAGHARVARRLGRVRLLRQPAPRAALGARARAAGRRASRARAARSGSSRCRSIRRWRRRRCASRRRGSGCSPTTA